MRVLTISDEVVPTVYSLSARERFSDVRCVFGCGDLPYYYLEYVVTTLAVPCFYVFGNHDSVELSDDGTRISAPRGCTSLEGRSERFGDLLLAGLGGSLRYNTSHDHQYEEWEMQVRLWRLAPRLVLNRLRYGRYLDVMLTHAPPLGIHNGPDRPHRGFQSFLTLLDYFRPRYLIHGHIHRSYGFGAETETRYKHTLVINTAGYRVLDM
ncbi:MAG TPA: metallophosphoesterase [Roseiflexaceae bacterium]|nr:metallophosphoesterase [Roseiflexaceae bacterium]